mmetsp:Transcript_73028/g.128990  ORF Transcript_73028/g.128990 Transcript_73028/m.128990 type:complete len:270 (-) Transcript_73028:109-918(-)
MIPAVIAHFIKESSWQNVASQLCPEVPQRMEAVREFQRRLEQLGSLHSKVWICAFCVNQHASICGGFGPRPQKYLEPLRYHEWMRKRYDTVTGKEHPICDCRQSKYWNDSGPLCEMNKFDDMMAFLREQYQDFTQLVAMDEHFRLLNRAWCVAELAEADRLGICQCVLIHSHDSLQKALQHIEQVRVQDCAASREQDKHDILQGIGDAQKIEDFNARVQRLLLGASGLLTDITDQQAAHASMTKILRRAWTSAPSVDCSEKQAEHDSQV